MSKAFFDAIRPFFGGRLTEGQVDGCDAILRATAGMPVSHRAYLLATAYHETAHTMQPLKETERAGVKRDDAQVIRVLDSAWAKGRLKGVSSPYWRSGFFGRGYVQITHEANYRKAGAALGINLVAEPELALVPDYAAHILVRGCTEGWFTGKKLSDYLPGDYVGARRVVNGTDKAKEIAGYAAAFEKALLAHVDAVISPVTPAKPSPAPVAPEKPEGLWAALWRALLARLTGKGE